MALEPSPGVIRAAGLLSLLADGATRGHPSMSASELARLSGVPRATCNSLLLGLNEAGLVRRNNDLTYALGVGCVTLGDAARTVNPVLAEAGTRAEALAQELNAVVAVTVRYGTETSVVEVFDFGPPIGYRVRPLESIRLVPPFGASFVAWDDAQIEHWLGRAEPPLSAADAARYRDLLSEVRRRGYSVSVGSAHQHGLATAFERLASGDRGATAERDEAMRDLRSDEYIAGEIAADERVRLIQISAPVFEPSGEVFVSLMLLGAGHDVSGTEIAALGARLASAAGEVTARRPGPPRSR